MLVAWGLAPFLFLCSCSKQAPKIDFPDVVTVDKDRKIHVKMLEKDSVFKAEIEKDMIFVTIYKPQTLFDFIEESDSSVE